MYIRTDQPDPRDGLVAKTLRDRTPPLECPDLQSATYDYRSVIRHLGDFEHIESPWVSCTFSLPFVIWEGHERRLKRRTSSREDHFISFVVSKSLTQGRAELATSLLRSVPPGADLDRQLMRFANSSQEILVGQNIPSEALLGTVPWRRVYRTLDGVGLLNAKMFEFVHEEKNEGRFRQFCDKLRVVWKNKMSEDAAVNQAYTWLAIDVDAVSSMEELAELRSLLVRIAVALFGWSHRPENPSVWAPPSNTIWKRVT